MGASGMDREPYTDYLRSAHWVTLRRIALEQAGHRCCLCGATETLQVHHNTYAAYRESLADLAVLCDECHRNHHLRRKQEGKE